MYSCLVVIVCLDLIEDRRRFMILAQERLNVDDFVFIFPDYLPEEGKTLPWVDYNGVNDGRDEEARRAFLKSFIVRCRPLIYPFFESKAFCFSRLNFNKQIQSNWMTSSERYRKKCANGHFIIRHNQMNNM